MRSVRAAQDPGAALPAFSYSPVFCLLGSPGHQGTWAFRSLGPASHSHCRLGFRSPCPPQPSFRTVGPGPGSHQPSPLPAPAGTLPSPTPPCLDPDKAAAGDAWGRGPSASIYLRAQSFWFWARSKPGLQSQATPPLGVSRQMWAQPWSLFMQFMPSGRKTDKRGVGGRDRVGEVISG